MRLGIELSAAACRLVEVDGQLPRDGRGGPPRVRSFAVLPPDGPDADSMFTSLKGRDAAVVVWGTPAEYRQAVVTAGTYEAMRREAVSALADAGANTSGALVDIAPVPGAAEKRRPVVAAVAAAEPLLAAVRPVIAAGVHVRSLATPAMALASLAHARRGVDPVDGVEAYIAIEEAETCIALMREGALAIARELPWGYVTDAALRPLDDIATRLASELEQYLDAVGAPRAAQVCICGGVPELRTMAAMLTERLDVEVEPLDSLFGIDEARQPEPSADFRDRVAELRLAWAVAADWPPHLNLLRARRRQQSRRILWAATVVAGVAVGVGAAWRIARSDAWPAPTSVARQAAVTRQRASAPTPIPAPPLKATPAPAPASPPKTASTAKSTVTPLPPPPPSKPAPVVPPPLLASRSALPRGGRPATLMRPPQTRLTPTLLAELGGTESTPSRVRPGSVPGPSPTAPSRAVPPPPTVIARQTPQPQPVPQQAPARGQQPAARLAPAPEQTPRPVATPPPVLQRAAPTAPAPDTASARPPSGTESTPSRVRPQVTLQPTRPAKPEPVLPFEASLETILYSADRQLAIIDGRIVGVGDVVRGARIVEISATAVMLRDGQGRLRRLPLGAGAK
jgi:hypothetical protein